MIMNPSVDIGLLRAIDTYNHVYVFFYHMDYDNYGQLTCGANFKGGFVTNYYLANEVELTAIISSVKFLAVISTSSSENHKTHLFILLVLLNSSVVCMFPNCIIQKIS